MNPETEFRDGLDDLAVHYKDVLKILIHFKKGK